MGATVEKAYLLCFNNKMEMLDCSLLSEGTASITLITARAVIERALLTKATAIIIAHNHPNGLPVASDADIDFTNQLSYLAKTLNITFLDHIIIAEGTYFPIIRSRSKPSSNECVFDANK